MSVDYQDLNQNESVLGFFRNFEGEKNYEKHYRKLEELSKYRIIDEIKLEGLTIPDVGPDPKINRFYRDLKDWDPQIVKEVQFIIKIYSGGSIETPIEAMILIEILLKISSEKKEILEKIKSDLESEELKNLEDYTSLLSLDVCDENTVYFNALFYYLTSILEN